jgi:arylsulfatase A
VRMGKWKAVKRDIKKNADAKLELYDLESDVSEKNNVAEKYPEIAAKMAKIMVYGRNRPQIKEFEFGQYPD